MKRPTTDPTSAVAYLRVSTDEQSLGPSAQREQIERWAAARGVVIVAWCDDLGVSGGAQLEDCPGLLLALDGLKTHAAGVLVVAKRDRLARDSMKAGMLEALVNRQGAKVISAAGEGEGDDPASVLMRRIIDAFSEYERLIIRARTKSALAVKNRRGELTGTAPYGFQVERTGPPKLRAGIMVPTAMLVPHPGEQAIIQAARSLREGGASIREVAEELTRLGHVPRSGGVWHPTIIRRFLGAKG